MSGWYRNVVTGANGVTLFSEAGRCQELLDGEVGKLNHEGLIYSDNGK
jgi:hypothetical protein